MGSYMSQTMGGVMDENMKKQQEFMLKTQAMQLGRQLEMQNQMRERQMSMMVARSRDLFMFFGSFYGLCLVGGVLGAMKSKKATPILPLVPLSFIFAYQYDLAYGNKMDRMRVEAERIMKEEQNLLELPQGLPSVQDIINASK